MVERKCNLSKNIKNQEYKCVNAIYTDTRWGKTYPTSSYMTSESCLGFIFSAPARLSASDCFTIEIICCRNSSCNELSDSEF